MATDGFASRWNGVAYPAGDERRLDSMLLTPGPAGEPFSVAPGRRVNGAGLQVSVGGSPEAITVTAGAGVIYDSGFASSGPWRFEIPASVSVTLPARPSTGQARVDLVVARLFDSDTGLGAVREVKIERVAGSPNASPTEPTKPNQSLILARLLVPASGTISVLQSTDRSVAAGGVQPVATTAVRDALPTYPGKVVFNEQTKTLEVYNGTSWGTATPTAFIRRTRAVQSIGSSSTRISLTTAGVSNDAAWTWSNTTQLFTCVKAGTYSFVFSCRWQANSSGRRALYPEYNGSTAITEGADALPGGNFAFSQQAIYENAFVAGDTMGAQALQTSGATLDLASTATIKQIA